MAVKGPHLPASTMASYVTSNNIRSCGSMQFASFGEIPKKAASNLSISSIRPSGLGKPCRPRVSRTSKFNKC